MRREGLDDRGGQFRRPDGLIVDLGSVVIDAERLTLQPVDARFTTDILRSFTAQITRYMVPKAGVGARIETGTPWSQPPVLHRPMAYEFGRPLSVIVFNMLHPSSASTVRPPGVLARRPSPMIDLYLKNAFSTRAC